MHTGRMTNRLFSKTRIPASSGTDIATWVVHTDHMSFVEGDDIHNVPVELHTCCNSDPTTTLANSDTPSILQSLKRSKQEYQITSFLLIRI